MRLILLVAIILATPKILSALRAIRIGRATMSAHRASVGVGVRMGRWQVLIGGFLAVCLIRGLV